jgi:hypothetical protein
MIWKDKRHVNMLMNMHHPPVEGNFCDKHGNTLKPVIIQIKQDYNQHMGYVDKSDSMTDTYSISSQLEAKHVLHWLEKGTRQRHHVFHEKEAE